MDFSIVIPVYNSAQSIEILCEEIRQYFLAKKVSFEIIFIDDYSDKSTRNTLLRLTKKEFVRVRFNHKNLGQQKTLLIGLLEAKGDIVVTIDDDLQHDIRALDQMLPHISDGADLVFGVYENYGDTLTRQWGSKLIGNFFKLKYKILNRNRISSYRVMTGELCRSLRMPKHHFVYISAELLRYSTNVKNVKILRRQRIHGHSGYTFIKCLIVTMKLFWYYGICSILKNQHVEDEKSEKANDGRRGQLSNKCN